MAKTDWKATDTVRPEDINEIGREINEALSRESVRTATIVIAASDSSDKSKVAADYVCTGTGDQDTINTAIQALPTGGGKVVLMEGTYTVGSSIKLVSNMTLEGMGVSTRIKIADDHPYDTLWLVSGNNVHYTTIKNLYIDGIDNRYGSGIVIRGSNNIFTGIICSDTGYNFDIRGNNNMITGNTCNNGIYGILIDGSSNLIIGNRGTGNRYYCISSAGNLNIVAGNLCNGFGVGTDGIRISGAYNTVTGNSCIGTTDIGINISGVGYNNVQINTVRDCQSYGIRIGSGTSNLVTNNDLYNSGAIALSDNGTDTITTAGNRI